MSGFEMKVMITHLSHELKALIEANKAEVEQSRREALAILASSGASAISKRVALWAINMDDSIRDKNER